jgi:hypothetical protein
MRTSERLIANIVPTVQQLIVGTVGVKSGDSLPQMNSWDAIRSQVLTCTKEDVD